MAVYLSKMAATMVGPNFSSIAATAIKVGRNKSRDQRPKSEPELVFAAFFFNFLSREIL